MKKFIALFVVAFALVSVQGAVAGEWLVDKSHTAVKFKVKHILTNVWGEFTDYDAELNYNAENPNESSVKVTINVNSIDTGNEKRDGHLRSEDFFWAEKYPTITFQSKKITAVGQKQLKVLGDLTIRGVTKEIELMVEGPSDPINFMGTTKAAASAEAVINRTDWGLTWNKALEAGNLLVGEDVTIVIDAELDKAE